MKRIILLLAILFISCETEEVTQEPCMCNLAKFYIPKIDQKTEITPPPLGLEYTYFQNIELDCTTGQPLALPTPNARFIKCEN